MKSSEELRNLLQRIDHRGYPAYKDTKGCYSFGNYTLSIDHVQGDPFAAPSKVSIRIAQKFHKIPAELFDQPYKRIALQDFLLRGFSRAVDKVSFKAKGSGKSGLLSVSRCSQEILERTACTIQPGSGELKLCMEVGFPANGRTINAKELIKIFFDLLPDVIHQCLFFSRLPQQKLQSVIELAEDQQYIREQLPQMGLTAFIANQSILPRESGISSRPMKNAIPFVSPASMEVALTLPHRGVIKGMGIPQGITLIVGGGYHGKSTLLKALETGVYNHISGDGREYVITENTAMKIRAEDGRSISQTDISFFINDLPNKKDTTSFSTEDASGSTSQAANIMESMESGTHTFLIDEDTSATNFMIRDELMQRVVLREKEPITPFIERVRYLYETCGISTVIVAGSSVCSLRNYRNCKRSRCGLSFHHTAGCTGRQALFPSRHASCFHVWGSGPYQNENIEQRRVLHQPRYRGSSLRRTVDGFRADHSFVLLSALCRIPSDQWESHSSGGGRESDGASGEKRTV